MQEPQAHLTTLSDLQSLINNIDKQDEAAKKNALQTNASPSSRKKVLLLEKDTFASLAIRTGFLLFGIECDVAFRAQFALELLR